MIIFWVESEEWEGIKIWALSYGEVAWIEDAIVHYDMEDGTNSCDLEGWQKQG